MANIIKTLRLPKELQQELDDEFARGGVAQWSTGIIDLLREAVRMRRVPGIMFCDGHGGRRATVAGTGLEVWEIVRTWTQEGKDDARLAAAYPRLRPGQLRAALTYYTYYPQEIDERMLRDARWTVRAIACEFGSTALGPGFTDALLSRRDEPDQATLE